MTTLRHAFTPIILCSSLLVLGACGPQENNPPVEGNQTPIAQDDAFSLIENTSLDLDVLSNDSDEDGDSLSIVGFDATSAQAGSVIGAGTFLRYTPEPDFTGTDTFTYRISDGKGAEDTATVTLTVGEGDPNNAPPSLAPIGDQTVIRNTLIPNTATISLTISDPDDDSFSVSIASDNQAVLSSSSLSCTLAPCEVTLAPKLTDTVAVRVTVSVTDGNGGQDETSFVMQVRPLLVQSASDNDADSLRSVVLRAEAGDVIGFDTEGVFSTPQTISLQQQIVLDKDLSIEGPGPDRLTISGTNITRAFKITGQARAAISGLTIADGQAPEETHEVGGAPVTGAFGGGILVDVASSLTLSDCAVRTSTATAYGLIDTCQVEGNTAGRGGGVMSYKSNVVINDSTIGGDASDQGNSAALRGGGIYKEGGNLTLMNSRVAGNQARLGGGIYNLSGLLTVDASTVARNQAERSGGGIYAFGPLTVKNKSAVTENSVADSDDGEGGGIYAQSDVTIDDSEIGSSRSANGGNEAAYGGGIYISQGSTPSGTITLTLRASSSVANNLARADGGGIFQRGNPVEIVIEESGVVANKANNRGGGVFVFRGSLTIVTTSCIVIANVADADKNGFGNGGGIYLVESNLSGVQTGSVCQNTPDDIVAEP
jgi:hypothetical protein